MQQNPTMESPTQIWLRVSISGAMGATVGEFPERATTCLSPQGPIFVPATGDTKTSLAITFTDPRLNQTVTKTTVYVPPPDTTLTVRSRRA